MGLTVGGPGFVILGFAIIIKMRFNVESHMTEILATEFKPFMNSFVIELRTYL